MGYDIDCNNCGCIFEVDNVWIYLALLMRRTIGGAVLCGNCEWRRKHDKGG